MKNCLVITLEKVYESVLHNNMLKLADNIVSDHKHDFNSENILLPSKWRYRVFHFDKVHQLMLELKMELHPTFPHQMCLKGLEYRLLWLWCYFKCLYLCFLSSFFWFSLMMQMECLWWCWYQSIIKQPMFASLMSHFILLIFNCLNLVFLPVQTENKVMSMEIWLNYRQRSTSTNTIYVFKNWHVVPISWMWMCGMNRALAKTTGAYKTSGRKTGNVERKVWNSTKILWLEI